MAGVVVGVLTGVKGQELAENQITAATQVEQKGPGSYTAAPNLYLRVKPSGSRSWVFRYSSKGLVKEIGLGKAGKHERTFAEAKDLAELMRRDLRDGRNPKLRVGGKYDAGAKTFNQHAGELIEAKREDFRNAKALQQWQSTIDEYCAGKHRGVPNIAAMPPKEITYLDVEAVLKQRALRGPDGTPKAETIRRLRQRIRAVLDRAAKVEGEPQRYNPAQSVELPKRKRGGAERNHPAAEGKDCPAIYAALKGKDSTSSLVLRWSILTAARSGEARGALWAEIEGETWAIPAERMKAGRLHMVPLCGDALEVLEAMAALNPKREGKVFPGPQSGLLSDVSVNKTLALAAKEAGLDYHVTAHGFRSSFRDWVAEETDHPREAAEWALAHILGKVEGSYQRSSLLERRRLIMQDWADFLNGKTKQDGDGNNVIDAAKRFAA